jgi:MFS family permease
MSFQNETKENLNDNLITKDTEEVQECPYKKDGQSEIKAVTNQNLIQENITVQKDIESPSSPVETIPKKKKWLFIELNPGISYFNLYSYYLVQFSYVCFCTYMDACQDYLLEDKRYYGIDKSEVGAINGDILLSDTLYLICFIYLYGSFHDIFGRKAMVVYGFLSMAVSLALYPLAGKVYPNLILVRLIFSNGICAVTTQPLLADYVNHKTKGFVGGIAAVVSGMGAIFAAVVLIKLQNYTDIKNVYYLTSAMCVIAAIICLFGVKNIQRGEMETNLIKRL